MASPSKMALDAVTAKLDDSTYGFAVRLEALTDTYEIQSDDGLLENPIDFSGDGNNFFVGNVDIAAILDSEEVSLPLVTLASTGVTNTARTKSRTFSGEVGVSLTVVLDWQQDNAATNFANHAQWIEDALVSMFNDLSDQDWGSGVSYNGDFELEPSEIVQGSGSNWLQMIRCNLLFEIDF